MRRERRIPILLMTLLVLPAVLLAPVSAARAAEAASPPSGGDSTGRTIVANVGSVMGTMVYAPFKALVLCPGMALAGGVTYAATLGKAKEDAEYLARVGCTGTYLITPGMVQGKEEFQGSGAR
jgi:hypothetical protein